MSNIVERAKASRHNGTHATMDFETKSRLSVTKVGAFRYALDPSTEILCLSWRIPGGELRLWHPWLESTPDELCDWIAAGGIVECHNAEFEYAVWKYIGHARHGWPSLSINQLRCSAAKAAALALPRALENVGIVLKLPVKKDMAGRRLMLKMAKPRSKVLPTPQEKLEIDLARWEKSKSKKKSPMPELVPLDGDVDREWNESFEECERLFAYNQTDVVTEELASERMVPLSGRDQKIFELTVQMNERGIYCDVELCKVAVRFAAQFKTELEIKLLDVTGGAIRTAKQNEKLVKFLKAEGVKFPEDADGEECINMQAATVAKLLKTKDISETARRVLEIRQSLAKSSITKYQTMINCAGPDNRIRGTLLFRGASTSRYSGRLIQPQNYAKAKIKFVENVFELLKIGDYELFKFVYPDVFTALSSGLRGMLRAAPGKILFSGDFNAIEARVILWLANDLENLAEYYRGDDPYKTMAALIFDVKYEDVTREQRELGKRAVLGCGFGMGPDKFFKTCADQGFPIPMELAEKAVRAYRLKYKAVRNFWYDLERAAITAVKRPGSVQKIGRLQWLYRGGFLICQLPSGTRISYSTPSIVATPFKYKVREVDEVTGKVTVRVEETIKDQIRYWAVHPKTKKWTTERTYGGKLAENVTQGTAAQIMIESMFRAETAGYMNIFCVHDELVCEADKGHGSVADFEKTMAIVPAWADGLPIKVEGWTDERYRK
jgi:Mesyanzhinovviridae DNA polymerase I